MDTQTLETIKQQLLAEKEQVEKDLGGFARQDVDNSENYEATFPKFGNKEDENAAEVAEYTDRLSLEHVLEKQLRDVVHALQSIEEGTYGICKHCGNPIEEKRLLVRPTSSSCVDCKKKLQGE